MQATRVTRLSLLVLSTISMSVVFSQTGPESDIPRQFVGAWRLVSWTQHLQDGTARQEPLTVANLLYSDNGRMCAVLMDPNRPPWASRRQPTESDLASTYAGLRSYCAAVEVNASEGFVLHHVEIDHPRTKSGPHGNAGLALMNKVDLC